MFNLSDCFFSIFNSAKDSFLFEIGLFLVDRTNDMPCFVEHSYWHIQYIDSFSELSVSFKHDEFVAYFSIISHKIVPEGPSEDLPRLMKRSYSLGGM